jgi:small subunit ribosomal protein S18
MDMMRNAGPSDFDMGRRRSRHLEGVKEIDSRDYELLRRFVTDHGKIMPSRFTGATPKQQRQLAKAIRRARVMGLLR